MEKHEIRLEDIRRILFGQAPAEFLLEVVIRTLIVYIALLIVVRLMGKRMVGQLTISEMAVMLTLGAIVSPGMQMPTTGLLLGMLILLCTLFFQRGINYLEFFYPGLESLNHGKMIVLLEDGVILLDELKRYRLSRQQLFAVLRNKGIYNLGNVDRIYLEACGLFSIYQAEVARPGLSVLPPGEENSLPDCAGTSTDNWSACTGCGFVRKNIPPPGECPNCKADSWTPAFSA
ncbi:MAG: hypothetical protein ABS46_14115 [Cytophagaceae bacterium SCN 52-12]|nr:MAG: hypothetical protein ABS46_14115 [Cytophagaceae bacterium SCN 52-12]